MAQGYNPAGTIAQGSAAARPPASSLPNIGNDNKELGHRGTGTTVGQVYPLKMAKLPKPVGQ